MHEPVLSERAARLRLAEIVEALVASCGVLPGRIPAAHASAAQRIRAAATAVGNRGRLFAAGRALHGITSRDGPPELPWFMPLDTAVPQSRPAHRAA